MCPASFCLFSGLKTPIPIALKSNIDRYFSQTFISRKSDVSYLYLLFTQDFHERAELTEQRLREEIELTTKIELIAVNPALSEDPIDIALVTNAAKQALELARSRAAEGDIFEFNFSSGTPTMKSTWSVLQAAGYAPHSRVWQVRNPSEMRTV